MCTNVRKRIYFVYTYTQIFSTQKRKPNIQYQTSTPTLKPTSRLILGLLATNPNMKAISTFTISHFQRVIHL